MYSRGCNASDDRGKTPPAVVEAGLAAAVAVAGAKDVDAVIIGLGLCGDNYGGGPPGEDPTCFTITESEGTDRADLRLPPAQMELYRRVLALGKPTVVFVMSAGPVDVEEIKASGVPIVAAGYGGEFGGQATAEVLAGLYNPGGALTTTVYKQRYAETTSFHDMSMRPGSSGNPSGRTYKFLRDSSLALWSFGHGQSYTTFNLSFSNEPRVRKRVDSDVTLRLELTNTGSVAGDCSITCFLSVASRSDDSLPMPPISWLFDFTRVVGLQPQEKRSVSFTLRARERELFRLDGRRMIPPAGTVTTRSAVASAMRGLR